MRNVTNIVNNYLYNLCCVPPRREVDLYLETLVADIQNQFPDISKQSIINALNENAKVILHYRTYSSGKTEISLISYQAY